jgi:N-formylglutamate amidohydrolase
MSKLLRTLLALTLTWQATANAAPCDCAPYLNIETGTLPLVFSVPHGGEVLLPDTPERTNGTKVQDDHVNELAAAIQRDLLALTGKQAWLVGAKISRKYVDFNREESAAYESPAAAPIYQEYYAALRRAVDQVRGQRGALLIDIHGQSADKGAIFRGTKDGLTARNAQFYTTPDGLITRLNAAGLNVQPAQADGTDNPHFNGGYIVRAFGYQTPQGIDAVQLEFGANWRATPERIEETARLVAAALVAHLQSARDTVRINEPGR